MEEQGIPVREYFQPVHRMPYVRKKLADAEFDLPVTDAIASRTMALPFHNGLTEEQIDKVVHCLRRAKDKLS